MTNSIDKRLAKLRLREQGDREQRQSAILGGRIKARVSLTDLDYSQQQALRHGLEPEHKQAETDAKWAAKQARITKRKAVERARLHRWHKRYFKENGCWHDDISNDGLVPTTRMENQLRSEANRRRNKAR